MESRPTSDKLTAYTQGLRRLFILQVGFGALALIAVAIGAWYISEKRVELASIKNDVVEAEKFLEKSREDLDLTERALAQMRLETDQRMSLNLAIADIGLNFVRAGTNKSEQERVLSRQLEPVLSSLPDGPMWDETRIELFKLRISLLESVGLRPQAVYQQAELFSLLSSVSLTDGRTEGVTPNDAANALLDLGALLCREGDRRKSSEAVAACTEVVSLRELEDQANYVDSCEIGLSQSLTATVKPMTEACSRAIAEVATEYKTRLGPAPREETAQIVLRPGKPATPKRPVKIPVTPIDSIGVGSPNEAPDSPSQSTSELDASQKLPDEDFTITTAQLHIRTEDQRASAIRMATALCVSGRLAVPEIKLIAEENEYPENARLVYYHSEQADMVQSLVEKIVEAATEADVPQWAFPPDTRLYQGRSLPRDIVEIWLDGRTGLSAGVDPADQSFSCRPG